MLVLALHKQGFVFVDLEFLKTEDYFLNIPKFIDI